MPLPPFFFQYVILIIYLILKTFLSLCAIFQYTLLPHQFCLYIIMCCFFYSSYFLFSYLLYSALNCAFNYFTILQAFPFSLSHSFITYSTYIGILISPSWLSWHALFHHVLLCLSVMSHLSIFYYPYPVSAKFLGIFASIPKPIRCLLRH